MARFLAGAAACFLLITGAFLLWQGQAQESPLPDAPPATAGPPFHGGAGRDPASARGDAQKPRAEALLASRQGQERDDCARGTACAAPQAYAKLGTNGNGTLSFDEWAVKTLDKFGGADKDRSGALTPAEYATTAPPPLKKKRCAC